MEFLNHIIESLLKKNLSADSSILVSWIIKNRPY